MPAEQRKHAHRPRRDIGRGVALFFCVIFALLGAVPLSLGILVRTGPVRAWAARETAALLAREFGIHARYDVHVRAWPMLIELDNLTIEARDAGPPFLFVERIAVRPRVFSLLAGQLDAGDVEIIGARARIVVESGELKNLDARLPEGDGSSGELPERWPFSSLAVTDARIDLQIDGTHVLTREVDLDVSAEEASALEVALRTGLSQVQRVAPLVGREQDEDSIDEDVICRLDGRIRLEPDRILLRRLTLQGSADLDPDPGTAPPCELSPTDWRAVDIRLGAVRIGLSDHGPPTVAGRVRARLPVALAHRFVDIPYATGVVGADVDIEHDGRSELPVVNGRIWADSPGLMGKLFATHLQAGIAIVDNTVELSDVDVDWGDGKVSIAQVKIDPLAKGMPLSAGPIEIRDVEFPGLLRDLGVHPRAHVAWSLKEGHLDYFRGTLDPLEIQGPIVVHTRGFGVFDHPTTDPARFLMMGVKEGLVRGTFQVRPAAVVLAGFTVDTPNSHVHTTVSLGYAGILHIEVHDGSKVDLSDISPLVGIPLTGQATVRAEAHGPFEHPKVEGEVAIKEFVFGGFPIGDVEPSQVAFEPLKLSLVDAHVRKGNSRIGVPWFQVAFDAGPDVLLDAEVDTRQAPHLGVRDLFRMLRLDEDPRWNEIDGTGSGTARVHFVLGGREDRCGGGFLDVQANMHMLGASLYGEHYDEGDLDVDFIWDDQTAGGNGMRIQLRSASLKKGTGTILAMGSVKHGGVIDGTAIAGGLPVSKLDVFGAWAKPFDGDISMVAKVGGTLSQLEGMADVQVSSVRIGTSSLPPSRFRVAFEPNAQPPRVIGMTRCGNMILPPFDRAEFDKDLSDGAFRADGVLFDGQMTLDGVRFSRQRNKVVTGKVAVNQLDLGTLANVIPGVAFSESQPKGTLSAMLEMRKLPLSSLKDGDATLSVSAFDLARDGQQVTLAEPSGPIVLQGNEIVLPELSLKTRTASGLAAVVAAGGTVHRAMTAPDLDIGVKLAPLDLSTLSRGLASVTHAAGTVDASLRVTGPPAALRYAGEAHLRRGELAVRDWPVPLNDIQVDIAVGDGDVRLKRATAKVGGGSVSVTGRMPIKDLDLSKASAAITARGVKLPVADGISLTADADLDASYRPCSGDSDEGEVQKLPCVSGTVSLTQFSYTRPIALSADLSSLAGRPQRTSVESYDPDDDLLRIAVNVVSAKPLRFSNNLVDMQLGIAPPGLLLTGTNQRLGARGLMRILPDSSLKLRDSKFDVREGSVRFDDPLKIAPRVDVRAETEYRRYGSSASTDAATAGATDSQAGATTATGATASLGGQWRILLRAHGDAENLKIDLTSDPPLSQEDVLLLLTVGMTRAELDRSLASSLGETVGLEALSQLTGADQAVRTIVPLIDEFRFGTAYSSRTGRTEPTVTLGKRITDDVRASVTAGITENREVRAGVEWKLGRRVGLQASYDNANDISSSSLGNIGADLRWRLEFE